MAYQKYAIYAYNMFMLFFTYNLCIGKKYTIRANTLRAKFDVDCEWRDDDRNGLIFKNIIHTNNDE